ncbi:hypothetical protein GCM10008018_50790 [Paenibacillus marchantiophytorum]|uniref:Uncharacterized protein n=1 Tax=Paenibacillus marchantiophytorum TaxID=1619310 RepID=A0ABQ1F3K9_9BACL|nr:hypothetical protein GCM10008018_50790 [Paenibacillus marchantiophytorum]
MEGPIIENTSLKRIKQRSIPMMFDASPAYPYFPSLCYDFILKGKPLHITIFPAS